MTVEQIIEKLKGFDPKMKVIIGGDGAYLDEVEGVYKAKVPFHKYEVEEAIIIAEWESQYGLGG